jgi:hypothetical protein
LSPTFATTACFLYFNCTKLQYHFTFISLHNPIRAP